MNFVKPSVIKCLNLYKINQMEDARNAGTTAIKLVLTQPEFTRLLSSSKHIKNNHIVTLLIEKEQRRHVNIRSKIQEGTQSI